MPDRVHCPMCADGEAVRSDGELDQCGNTYLPTSVWSCASCGYVRYDPAVVVHWRPRDPRRAAKAPQLPERLSA